MTALQRETIEKILKKNQVAVNIAYKEIGVDELGLPNFEITYENPPKNYRLVRMIEAYRGAILEDLDYVATQPEPTP